MPVFISYNNRDSDFATKLALQLVKHKARVWIDQWELHVGDSIIDHIQNAIQGASALLVILSKSSIESEWCKKELSSGLLRELEEQRVIVLPLLIEDCEIPLFLRGKLYADFRTDFDEGLEKVLEAIARVTSENLGRHEDPEWIIDWAIDEGFIDDIFTMKIILVEQAKDQPYSTLTEILVVANNLGTERYLKFIEEGIAWIEQAIIIEMLAEEFKEKDFRVLLEDQHPKIKKITMQDSKSGTAYNILVTSRRLGQDTGRDILLNLSGQFQMIREAQKQVLRKPTTEELERIKRIQSFFENP